MNRPWMRDYARHLIDVCHRHGAFAMGGMAAFTPGRDAEARQAQTEKVVADKQFEASIGHDGCWVSHPYFIGPAFGPFLEALEGAQNQLGVHPDIVPRPDLMPLGGGPYTLGGLRTNVRVGIAYLKGWNEDIGCVAWDDLMEDLATLEISRAQTVQWRLHGVTLESGETVTDALVASLFDAELATILSEVQAVGDEAVRWTTGGPRRPRASSSRRTCGPSSRRAARSRRSPRRRPARPATATSATPSRRSDGLSETARMGSARR